MSYIKKSQTILQSADTTCLATVLTADILPESSFDPHIMINLVVPRLSADFIASG